MKDGPTRRFRRALRRLDKFRWSQSAEWGNPAIAEDCAKLIFRRGEAQGGAEIGLSLFRNRSRAGSPENTGDS
jgi:hypothetical protein